MNQILVGQGNEKLKNPLNGTLKVFSILIILFGIIFISKGAYGFAKERENLSTLEDIPEINIQRDGRNTILNISSRIGVEKLIYSWNDGEDNTITENGQMKITETIATNIGTSELNLKIVDSDGNTITYDSVTIIYDGTEETANQNEELSLEEQLAADTTGPIIEINSVKGKIVIYAYDEVKMSYITYSWNGEDEIKVTGLSDDEKSITTEIDSDEAIQGNNTLLVKAYDLAGNVTEQEKTIQGVSGPTIQVTQDQEEAIVEISNNSEITKIIYSINGVEQTIDNISQTEYTFTLDLNDGDNSISITAYSGTVKSEYECTMQKPTYGTNGPNIDVVRSGDEIIITVTDSTSIDEIKYNFNGEKVTVSKDTIQSSNPNEYKITLQLVDGENYVIVYAYRDNEKSEFTGKTTK